MQNNAHRSLIKQPRFHRRRGYTLIHCLMMISVLATVSTIGVGLISTLLRTERQGIAHITRLSSLSNLSRQFRTDAHAATLCEPLNGSEGGVVRLALPNHESVVYARHDRGITRTQQKGDLILRRNVFRLPDVQLRYERASDQAAIVTLVVGLPSPGASKVKGTKTTGASPNNSPPHEFRVDAQLSRNAARPAPLAVQDTTKSPN
jgi:Tfp pilus assembly protein FimT